MTTNDVKQMTFCYVFLSPETESSSGMLLIWSTSSFFILKACMETKMKKVKKMTKPMVA